MVQPEKFGVSSGDFDGVKFEELFSFQLLEWLKYLKSYKFPNNVTFEFFASEYDSAHFYCKDCEKIGLSWQTTFLFEHPTNYKEDKLIVLKKHASLHNILVKRVYDHLTKSQPHVQYTAIQEYFYDNCKKALLGSISDVNIVTEALPKASVKSIFSEKEDKNKFFRRINIGEEE